MLGFRVQGSGAGGLGLRHRKAGESAERKGTGQKLCRTKQQESVEILI